MYTTQSHNTKLGLVTVLKSVYGSQLAQPRCHFNMAIAMRVTPQCIDRSHRLGRQQPSTDKPRPVIVKFVSYETRRQVFSAKRRLKGCKLVITENLTKRRTEMLNRTRTQPGVKCAWTTDGRIVCLLENGEKRTIVTERDLTQLHRHQ